MWHETMHIDDLWEGDMAPVDVQGTKVSWSNVDGEVGPTRTGVRIRRGPSTKATSTAQP